jgi:hypothetical protein
MTRVGTVVSVFAVGVLILAGPQGQGAETLTVRSGPVGCALHTDSKDREGTDGGVHSTPYEDWQAVVVMKAIPSAARAAQLYQQQATHPLAAMSDNTDSYEGRLILDLDRGQVREYAEQMQNEWIHADPSSIQKGLPVAIRMAATRLHRLERLP